MRKASSVEPFTDTNTLPLSIAEVSSHPESRFGSGSEARPGTDGLELHDHLLAAVVTRAGEVEAAEWALDQAKAACQQQLAAALSAGVPIEKIAGAAGVCASALAGLVGDREREREPVPAGG